MSERWFWAQKEDIGPSPRYAHSMEYEAARQRVILFGGEGDETVTGGEGEQTITRNIFNDTWAWDGAAWTQVADMGPSARLLSRMAYDDSRQRLVLFGGASPTTFFGDTWEWDGTEWTQVADIGPAARHSHELTYDTVRKRVMLFGGANDTDRFGLNDTWEWDGTEWTQVADMGPPRRLGHTMVFDSSRECLVLFGGSSESGGVWNWIGDTWEWGEDAGWVKRQDMGPQSMVQPKMVHSDAHTVLFGYGQDPSDEGHTWEWNDNLWTQRQDMGPPHRTGHDLAYDSKRNRVVLFGGWGETLLADTWELEII